MVAQAVADPDSAGVEALLQDLRHCLRPVGTEVPVLELVATLSTKPLSKYVVFGVTTLINGRGHRDRLDYRTRLVEVSNGAFTQQAEVRVLQGELGKLERWAEVMAMIAPVLGSKIKDRAAARLVQLDLVVGLCLNQALQVAVDRQTHVRAGGTGDDAVASKGDRLAAAVLLEKQEAGFTA